jgi:hypothetical protein
MFVHKQRVGLKISRLVLNLYFDINHMCFEKAEKLNQIFVNAYYYYYYNLQLRLIYVQSRYYDDARIAVYLFGYKGVIYIKGN